MITLVVWAPGRFTKALMATVRCEVVFQAQPRAGWKKACLVMAFSLQPLRVYVLSAPLRLGREQGPALYPPGPAGEEAPRVRIPSPFSQYWAADLCMPIPTPMLPACPPMPQPI